MVAALNPVRLRRYLWQVAAATFLVAVCPILVVWWLRTSGTIGTAPLGMALAIGLSLGASYVGRAFWETRTSSGDLLFGELMVWGFIRRWRNDRRLASALQMLGPMNERSSASPPMTFLTRIRRIGGAARSQEASKHPAGLPYKVL